MSKMSHSRQLLLAVILLVAIPCSAVFGQEKEATAAAKKYLAALEGLQMKAAYASIAADERTYKTLEQFQADYPALFIKAMRTANKNFFRFKVKSAKADGDLVQVTAGTTDLVFTGQDIPMALLFNLLQSDLKQKKLDPNSPAQLVKDLQAMVEAGMKMKTLPFGDVDKVISMLKVKGAWYVRTGWQEAALKAQEEEKVRQAQAAESQAQGVVDHAKTWPSDFSEDIGKLQALKDKAPGSKVISDGLELLAKMQKNMDSIQLEATSSDVRNCRIRITNNGEFAVSFLIMEYSLLDADGNVLKHEDNFQQGMRADDPSIDPRLTNDWCPPGYTGLVASILVGFEDPQLKGWAKTEVKLKGVSYHFD